MKSFDHSDLADFLNDPSFRAWVRGHATPDEADWWAQYAAQHSAKAVLLWQARETLLGLEQATFPANPDRVNMAIDSIMAATEPTLSRPGLAPATWRFGWAVTATVLICLLAGWGWHLNQQRPVTIYKQLVAHATVPMQEVVNDGSKTRLVLLADGSSVVLQPNSRISYPANFTAHRNREVYLTGEAFFEVAKNPHRPFLVYADKVITKVLGTSFTVRATAKEGVDVVVKTGRVSVFTRDDGQRTDKVASLQLKGLVLAPNQQVRFDRADNHLTRSLVESPARLDMVIQRPVFEFNNTPVSTVFAALTNAYGIEIIYDADMMKNCYLTASLDDEPLFEKLTMICRTLDAQYEQMDGKLIISSKGCP
ncbi:FecR family protein [Spirosoma rhododendri]|uniref:DUF4974 domain-containing protein n=1 Tax=Spirosoma rhododendri TaxID=2728024 RepID=A0A7L5DSL7_9BACT|nr:FecR family protein [Spirosoma rhododendri]QJD78957.1 DUF4974 domain-containing protein [Spirosoma rhododendri]